MEKLQNLEILNIVISTKSYIAFTILEIEIKQKTISNSTILYYAYLSVDLY